MPSKKHSFTRTEILAGLLVIVSVAVLAGFIALIQGMRPPQETVSYFAGFTNTIGLKPGAEVRFGGMIAGRVANVIPDPEDQTRLLVEAAVQPEIPVNVASVATVKQLTLTSDKHLEISTGKQDAAKAAPGSRLQSVTLSGEFIDIPDVSGVVSGVENLLDDIIAFLGVDEAEELEAKGGEEFANLARVTADVRGTLSEATELVGDLRETLADQQPNIDELFAKVQVIGDSANDLVQNLDAMLAENRAPLHETLLGVQETVDTVRGAVGGVDGIVADAGKIVEDVAEHLGVLMETLRRTLENAEGLSGTARAFLDENRPGIEDIISDLGDTMENLEEFSRTLAEQPQSVLRGKTPEGRKN